MATIDDLRGGSSRSSGGGKRKLRTGGGTITVPELSPTPQSIKSFAAQLAQLQVTGGDGKDIAKDLLKRYGKDIPQEQLDQYGLQIPTEKKSIWKRVPGALTDAAGSVLGNVLNLINRPSQAALAGIQAGASTVREAFGGEEIAGNVGYGGIIDALKGEGHLNLRSTVGKDPNSGGRLAGFFDLGGTIATDPLTLLTLGTGQAAKVGLKIAGEETANIIRSGGIEALGKEGAEALTAKIAESTQAGLAKAHGPLRARLFDSKSVFDPLISTADEAGRRAQFANRTMTNLERTGQGGVKFLGSTVPGLGTENLGKLRAAFGHTDEAAKGLRGLAHAPANVFHAVTNPVTSRLKKALIPRSAVTAAKGAEASARLHEVFNKNMVGGFNRLMDDAVEQIHHAAKGEGMAEAEITAIRDSLENGTVQETAAALRADGHEAAASALEAADNVRHQVDAEQKAMGVAKTAEDVEKVRQETADLVRTRLQHEAAAPIEGLETKATVAKRRFEKQSAKLQKLKEDLQDLTIGRGRSLTAHEGERIGRAGARSEIAVAQAKQVEKRLARAEEMAPGVYDHAFSDAIDDAMAKMPRGKVNAASARTAADRAFEEFHALQNELASAEADGLRITESEIQRYGKLEGIAKVKEQVARKAERQQARIEAIAHRQMQRAGKTAEKAADTSSLAKVAERSRARAEGAVERLNRIVDEINAKAATADAPTSAAMQRRLGAFEERVRVTERQLKDAEAKVAAQRERFRTVAERRAPQIEKIAEKAAQKYIRNNYVLMNTDKHLLRAVTPEGEEALREAGLIFKPSTTPGAPGELHSIMTQGGKTESRGPLTDLAGKEVSGNITDLNPQFAEILKKEPGFKTFEDNPLVLTLKNANAAYRATQEVRYINDVAKIGEELEGRPWVLVGDDNAQLAAEYGYEPVQSGTFDKVWADPVIKPELERLHAVTYNDAALKDWDGFINQYGSLWAGYATTPVLFGTGFFARNATGNMFNSALLGGVMNFGHYKDAITAARGYHKVVKELGRKAGPEFNAALIEEIGPELANKMNLAIDNGIRTSGFFSPADLGSQAHEISEIGKEVSTLRKFGRKINPLDKKSIWLEPGTKLNGMIEDNARLGHFFGKMDELGDAALAGRSVQKYLIDYSDLTRIEKEHIRKYVRFYTYARKNTPLQFLELTKTPGKYAALEHARREVATQFSGDQNGPYPSYSTDQGDIPIGKFLIGSDTPFQAAMQQVEPGIKLLANLPGVKDKVLRPAGLENLAPEKGFPEVARGILGVPQGGPVELGKFVAEEAFGKSLFTGADIKKGGGNTAIRLAQAILPLATKANKTVTILKNSDEKDQARVRLLNTLLGFHVTPTGQQSISTQYSHLASLTEDAIQRLKDEGVSVPTIDDMRAAGIIPEAPKATRKKSLSPTEKREEALARLEAEGVDTSKAGTYKVKRGKKTAKRKIRI